MSRETIQEELEIISGPYSIIKESQSPDSLRHLQQTFVHLGEALEREIQTTTLTDMEDIANRTENLEELFSQEIAMLGMWLVSGGNTSEILDAVYKESIQSLRRIMEEMKTLKKEPLTTEALGVLQDLTQEGFRLTQAMTARQEHMDRFQKYERAIKTLSPEDRQFLMEPLNSIMETVCRTRA